MPWSWLRWWGVGCWGVPQEPAPTQREGFSFRESTDLRGWERTMRRPKERSPAAQRAHIKRWEVCLCRHASVVKKTSQMYVLISFSSDQERVLKSFFKYINLSSVWRAVSRSGAGLPGGGEKQDLGQGWWLEAQSQWAGTAATRNQTGGQHAKTENYADKIWHFFSLVCSPSFTCQ